MAKKYPPQPLTEIFIVLNSEEEYQGKYNTLIEAQNMVDQENLDGAFIMKVVQVWEAQWPDEPEIEFHELALEQV